MSEPSTCEQQTLQKERRTRKTHSKVRTGCITCKLRRKKCDETKPWCLRCSSIGRQCDGYQQSPPDPASIPKIPPPFSSCVVKIDNRRFRREKDTGKDSDEEHPLRPIQCVTNTICRAPSMVTFASEADYHCFDYFRFKTGPYFESYFESLMWRAPAIRAAFSHPIVLKIATAVGAVNQRFNHGISRKAFELCATADRLYRDALKEFNHYLGNEQASPRFHEISMIASMLIALFQSFQGNYEESVESMAFAMKSFWNRPFTITHSESQYFSCHVEPPGLIRLFRRLWTRIRHVFGSSPEVYYYKPGRPLPPAPARFQTPEEARDSIFTELEWILYLPVRIPHDEKLRREAQNLHMSRIFQWSVAMADLVKSQGDRTSDQKEVCRLLKAVRDATFFVLYTILFIEPETFYTQPSVTPLNLNVNTSADLDTTTTTTNPTNSDPTWPNEHDPSLQKILTELSALITKNPNLSTRYTRLNLLGEAVTNTSSPWFYVSHDYGADTGIGPPRQSHLLYESSAKTRHMVRCLLSGPCTSTIDTDSILTKGPIRESNDVYALAERVASFEEHAVLAAVKKGLIPNGPTPEWIDIRFFHEERKILLRYCRPDGLGERSRGLVWVQQWLEF